MKPTQSHCHPLFIVGMNGSGTTMLLDSLGRHKALYSVPVEMLLMPHVISRADRFGDLTVRKNFLAYRQFALQQLEHRFRIFDHTGRRHSLPDPNDFPGTVEGVFDSLFRPFAEAQGKQRWCEKTPDHVQWIPRLAATFPGSQFIHMIRDGREVACSVNRRHFKRPDLVMYRWKKLVRSGMNAGQKLGSRYLEVKYEDLAADSAKEMQRICGFLGVDYDESVLLSRLRQNPARKKLSKGEVGRIMNNPVKWPTAFEPDQVERLERIGGSLLHELGYPVAPDRTGDEDLSPARALLWRLEGYCHYTRALMKRSKKYDSWDKVLRNFTYSLKGFRQKKY